MFFRLKRFLHNIFVWRKKLSLHDLYSWISRKFSHKFTKIKRESFCRRKIPNIFVWGGLISHFLFQFLFQSIIFAQNRARRAEKNPQQFHDCGQSLTLTLRQASTRHRLGVPRDQSWKNWSHNLYLSRGLWRSLSVTKMTSVEFGTANVFEMMNHDGRTAESVVASSRVDARTLIRCQTAQRF